MWLLQQERKYTAEELGDTSVRSKWGLLVDLYLFWLIFRGLKVVRPVKWILSTSGNNLVMGCIDGCYLGGKD